MKIYTKTGDTGQTSLYGGKRVAKNHPLICAYGAIDELNSLLGVLVGNIKDIKVQKFLFLIQNDLMVIGSYLAGSKLNLEKLLFRIGEMEGNIDRYWQTLPPLKNFIIPGGSQISALTQLVRSVTRRVEREVIVISENDKNIILIVKYLNRLSDYFFVLARYQNYKARKKRENMDK